MSDIAVTIHYESGLSNVVIISEVGDMADAFEWSSKNNPNENIDRFSYKHIAADLRRTCMR